MAPLPRHRRRCTGRGRQPRGANPTIAADNVFCADSGSPHCGDARLSARWRPRELRGAGEVRSCLRQRRGANALESENDASEALARHVDLRAGSRRDRRFAIACGTMQSLGPPPPRLSRSWQRMSRRTPPRPCVGPRLGKTSGHRHFGRAKGFGGGSHGRWSCAFFFFDSEGRPRGRVRAKTGT